jgi:tRNA-splicing ligase RtcB
MKVISTEKIPIKMWLSDIEEGALEQGKHLANLPFAFKHIAIMPDSHQGFGMPIGGVLATKDIIVPNAVGVDIGCGMCAVKTSLTEIDRDTLKKIMGEIRKAIPVGFAHHKEKQDERLMPPANNYGLDFWEIGKMVCQKEYKNALTQIGTLGGGNHFIEIQKGSDGHIWIMIHSGSRNLGKQVADYYNKLAVKLNEKWYSSVPKEWELAFLPVDSEEGQTYIREMQYCVDFALANRKLMMDRIQNIFVDIYGFCDRGNEKLGGMYFEEIINIAHNYASLENHFGKNVWVHRKGATLAREDTIGIIPGSMGTKS